MRPSGSTGAAGRAGATFTFRTMGTLGYASWSPSGLDIGHLLAARADEIDHRLTRFRDDSEICRLSDSWRPVSADAAAVLGAAAGLQDATSGYFTPLLGVQARAWDQLATGFLVAVPEVTGAAGRVEVAVCALGARARLVDAAVGSVDLGAIAKGYAADQLRDLAVALGASDVLMSLGGSSMAVAGAPATIGLASPWQGRESFGTLQLASGSLSVSADPGTTIHPGRQRSHVLDPATGAPAMTDLSQVVVCGPDGMVCEAFSTAFLAMGLDDALLCDQDHPEFDTIFMTTDGRVLASPGLTVKASPGVQDWLAMQSPQRA